MLTNSRRGRRPTAALARLASALLVSLAAAVVEPSSARAQDAVALAEQRLDAGTLAAGESALAALSQQNAGDDNARFGLAGIRFMRAIEGLVQSLHRHGLTF
jgi:hypothetical protein